MEALQKELIQCDMCCDKTENVQTYTCQHKICYKCFYKILIRSYIKDIASNDNINIDCVCKKGKLSLNIDEIYQILIYLNNTILKNATNEIKEGKILKCVNHVSLKQLYFCIDCKEDICENCFIEGAEHYQHRVISTKDYIDSLKRNLEHFPNLDTIIAKHEHHIKEGFNDYSKKINLIFDKAVKEITLYKNRLIEKVKEKVQKYETSMKIVNLLFKYFNYEVGHLSNDIHELLFLMNTKVILPEINYHCNQTEKDMENIIKMIGKMQCNSSPELKLNQKLSHLKCVQTIEKAHEIPITSMCLLDNLKMASGDEQGNIQLWKMTRKGFTSLQMEKCHNTQIDSIFNLSQGKFVSFGKKEDYLIFWKATSSEIYEKKQILTINNDKDKDKKCILCINKMKDNDSIIVYLSNDAYCFYKDKSTDCEYLCESCYLGNSSPISNMLVLSNNKILASSPDSKVFIYSYGELEDTLPGSKEEKNPLVEMDNLQFASGGEDNKISIWDCVDNKYKRIHTLSGHLYPVTKLIYLGDGRIISGSKDSFIKIWIKNNKYEYECNMTLREHKEEISGLINVDDNTVISASFDRSIKIWLGYKMLI